jgi:hypothetical protein
MKRLVGLVVLLGLALLPAVAVAADGKRPMTVEDLFRFKRVADPQISPDGKTVAYVVTTVDLPGNKTSSTIWLAPTVNGPPRQLTNTTKKDRTRAGVRTANASCSNRPAAAKTNSG